MEFDLNRDVDWEFVWEWAFKIGAALLILLITHFIAKGVKWAIAKMVDRIPALQRHSESQPGETVGSQIGTLAYWIVWLVGLVVALQPLELSGVLDPIEELTTNVFGFLPNLIGAGLWIFFGVIIANVVRKIVETALMAINADEWLARAGATEITGGEVTEERQNSLSSAIGTIVFVLIIIPFATAALENPADQFAVRSAGLDSRRRSIHRPADNPGSANPRHRPISSAAGSRAGCSNFSMRWASTTPWKARACFRVR